MKKTLEIEFKLDDDKTKTISLSDPKDDLTLASVTPWANNVVAKKAFIINGAFPVALKSASIRTVDVQELT